MLTLDGNEGVFYAGAAQVEIEYPEELLVRLDSLRAEVAQPVVGRPGRSRRDRAKDSPQ